uniref:ATP synthase F0 subunit 8 n=1 Tax=Grateloupia elliptica TaxID=118371 RepID=UPI0020282605|nr:ATP synthase F0 subunit 8 [Grateloupia elliptica]UQJ72541.1 ATP synthase F0 subunit 8 [Grateloupia elliptica]UYI31693.1 ATP synthase F0 subunit 8 [Grateloupia elliptica]
MPQLDRIIVFSQIFWLFIIFTVFYTILTHFFLPKFLAVLKSRKQIIEVNALEIAKIKEKSILKRNLIQKILAKDLALIKNILVNNLDVILSAKQSLNTSVIDEKVALIILNTVKYCDMQLLSFILLRPKSLNLKLS